MAQQDYRKLAGMEKDSSAVKSLDFDNRSKSSRRSKRSTKSARADRMARSGKWIMKKINDCDMDIVRNGPGPEEDLDSRAGDFDTADEDDALSVGSDASRLRQLDEKLKENALTMGEKYSEKKLAEGSLLRLEDAELPDALEDEETFKDV